MLDVVYTNLSREVPFFLQQLKEKWFDNAVDHEKFLGLDLDYTADQRGVAVIQLCFARHVLIFQRARSDKDCPELMDFLRSGITFASVDIRNDKLKMRHSFGIEIPAGCLVDLQTIMAHATVTLNFNTFLEKAKLKDDGSIFVDRARNLKLILQAGKKDYVLNAALGDEPPATADQDVKNAWLACKEDYSVVQCAVLYGLEPGLQHRFERHGAFEMFQELKFIFQKNARIERYETSDKFYACKMEENSSVSEHVLKMSGVLKPSNEMGIELRRSYQPNPSITAAKL
ncbi:hypothetical protein ZWY2020_023913 [Hordeum vulgare]|nr:hypothetical protein ZWY2020_023913 [Hordeum vulgare]